MSPQLSVKIVEEKNKICHYYSRVIRKSYYLLYIGFVVICTSCFIAVAYQ